MAKWTYMIILNILPSFQNANLLYCLLIYRSYSSWRRTMTLLTVNFFRIRYVALPRYQVGYLRRGFLLDISVVVLDVIVMIVVKEWVKFIDIRGLDFKRTCELKRCGVLRIADWDLSWLLLIFLVVPGWRSSCCLSIAWWVMIKQVIYSLFLFLNTEETAVFDNTPSRNLV